MSDFTFQMPFRFNVENSRQEIWWVSDLPPNEELISKPVDRLFVESVAERGILTPIWVALLLDHNNKPFVVAGSRRIKAARLAGIDRINVVVRDMTLVEAMTARSIENNKRSDNSLADIQSIQYLLNFDPELANNPKLLAKTLGMNLGRLKTLLPQVQASRLFLDAVSDGHISEETLRKVTTMPPSIQAKAVQRFAEAKAKYVREVAAGKVYATPPIFLSDKDLRELQFVRKQDTVQTLPLFGATEEPSVFDDSVLAQLGVEPEVIDGYVVLYEDANLYGDLAIHNYAMYNEADARAILADLQASYPDLKNLHLAKVTPIQ